MLRVFQVFVFFISLLFYPQSNSAQTITIEAETLTNTAVTNTNAGVQNMSSFGSEWSQDKQLFWQAYNLNDYLTLFIEVSTPGNYDISLTPTLAPDYGSVKAYQVIPGKPLIPMGKAIDGYSPEVKKGGRVELGNTYLNEGKNQISFYVVGKSDASNGYFFGIDDIQLNRGKVATGPLPDLVISEEIYINDIKYNLENEIILNSDNAISRSEGRCFFPTHYFIENTGQVNIDDSFQSTLFVTNASKSISNINNVGANEKRKINASLRLEPGIEKKIYILADSNNTINELSEENNNSAIIITLNGNCEDVPVGVVVLNKKTEDNNFKISPGIINAKPTKKNNLSSKPDIDYHKESDSSSAEKFAKLDNPDLIVGITNPMTKNITVKNQGQTATKVSSKILINCEFTDFNGIIKPCKNSKKLEEINLSTLQPGKQKTLIISNFNFSNPAPGKYKFEIIADSGNSIDESNESNNISVSKLNIKPPPPPEPPPPPPAVNGEDVFNNECSGCHDTGASSIPQLGNQAEWNKRENARGGFNGLVNSAKNGYLGMPGFNSVLTDEEITKSVKYLCNCN